MSRSTISRTSASRSCSTSRRRRVDAHDLQSPLTERAKRLVPPARVDLVELADESGKFEVALAGIGLGEALHVGARLAGKIVAHDVERPRRRRVELDLAGPLQPIEPQEGFGHRAA